MIVAIPVPTIEVQTYPGPSVAITVPETANFIKNLRIKMIWAKLKQKIPIRAVNYWPKMWGWAVSRKCPETLKRFLIYIYTAHLSIKNVGGLTLNINYLEEKMKIS